MYDHVQTLAGIHSIVDPNPIAWHLLSKTEKIVFAPLKSDLIINKRRVSNVQ